MPLLNDGVGGVGCSPCDDAQGADGEDEESEGQRQGEWKHFQRMTENRSKMLKLTQSDFGPENTCFQQTKASFSDRHALCRLPTPLLSTIVITKIMRHY